MNSDPDETLNIDEVKECAEDTLNEWLQGYFTVNTDLTYPKQVRFRRQTDGSYRATDPGGYVHFGDFKITVVVEKVKDAERYE